MTEAANKQSLDKAIKDLIAFFIEIKDIIFESKGADPYWGICISKFQTSYLKLEDVTGYREMFLNFHEKFHKEYCINVYTEDNEGDIIVNDSFLRNTTMYTIAGEIKKTVDKKSHASRPPLKGPVIYFSTKEQGVAGVCIAIGEVYRKCIDLYDTMEKNNEDDSDIRILPSRFLYKFYNVMYHAHGGEILLEQEETLLKKTKSKSHLDFLEVEINSKLIDQMKIIKENLKSISRTISQLSNVDPNDDASKNSGSFNIITNIVDKLTGGKNPVLPGGSEVGKVIQSVVGDTQDLQNVMGNVMSEIGKSETNNNNEPPQMGTLLGSIATVLTSPSTTETFTKIQSKITSLTGDMASSTTNNEPASSSAVSHDDADIQE